MEGIDPAKGEVALRDGRIFPYDVLVMATGTSAFVPDLPGLDLPGVVSLRNLEDAIAIKTRLKKKMRSGSSRSAAASSVWK